MNIDEVLEVLEEVKVRAVDGNIIFPSSPRISSEAEVRAYAAQVGLTVTRYGSPEGEMPRIYPLPGQGKDVHFLQTDSLQMFQTLMKRFNEHEQLPPYFIMVVYQHPATPLNNSLSFNAASAKLELGRVVAYDYECLGDLDIFKAR